MSYIKLPYGLVKKSKQIQFNLPKNYEESQYIKRLPYISNKGPDFNNKVLDLLRNWEDFKKWLLATSDYGNELQEDLNTIVSFDEKFNNAIVRHALDLKTAGIFQNPNPPNLTFCDLEKFDLQNPIIGKLATQVKASKLTEDQLTKKNLMQDQIVDIENRLEELRKLININDNSDDDMGAPGGSGARGGGNDGTPSRPPGRDEFDELTRRLNRLRGNRPPLSPPRKPHRPRPDVETDLGDGLNNRVNRLRYDSITPNHEEKILTKRLSERQREITQIPKTYS